MCEGPDCVEKRCFGGMEEEVLGFSADRWENFSGKVLLLLDLSASDDLVGFKQAVEEDGSAVDEAGLWYGRNCNGKLGTVQRTPLMIAALFGSVNVLKYILSTYSTCGMDVNCSSSSDRATALHCAAVSGSPVTVHVVKLLVDSGSNPNPVDAAGKRPGDLILVYSSLLSDTVNELKSLLHVNGDGKSPSVARSPKSGFEKKEYPVDPSMPDIKNGMYSTDEFRMYVFKVKLCSRAYSHDWTECPFVHPGENARRRDPRKFHYSCVPCPDFRKGACRRGDSCEYAHGVFECWLHPAQYRTRLCKDEINCPRRVCFFAHKPEELRSLYPSMGSGLASPRLMVPESSPFLSPLALNSPSVMLGASPLSPSVAVGAGWQFSSGGGFQESRLRTSLNANNLTVEDLAQLEIQQRFLDDLSACSALSPKFRNIQASSDIEEMLAADLLAQMGFTDPSGFKHNSIMSGKVAATVVQSQLAMRPTLNYGVPSSPVRTSSPRLGLDMANGSSSPMLSPSPMNSPRSASIVKRSQSFLDGGALGVGLTSSSPMSKLSDWSSPNGKLDWGVHGEELNKLRKSASFAVHSSGPVDGSREVMANKIDISSTQPLPKESPAVPVVEPVNQNVPPLLAASAAGFVPWACAMGGPVVCGAGADGGLNPKPPPFFQSIC